MVRFVLLLRTSDVKIAYTLSAILNKLNYFDVCCVLMAALGTWEEPLKS